MAVIANLDIQIGAKTAQFTKGLSKAKGSMASFKASITSVVAGALALAGTFAIVTNSIRKSADEIDRLAKTSSKLGLGTRQLGALEFAAKQTGVATQTFDMALQRMVRRVNEASHGTGEAKAALIELGLSARKLAQMSPDQQFLAIADAMKKVSNDGDRVRLAFKLFDSEGVSLVNTLKLGSREIQKLGNQANRLNMLIDDDAAKQVEAMNDAFSRLGGRIQGIKNQLTAGFAPIITSIVDVFAPEKGLANPMQPLTVGIDASIDAFDRLQMKSAETAKLIAQQQAASAAKIKAAFAEAEQIFSQTRNPFENLTAQLERLDELNKLELLDPDTFKRARMQALESAEAALGIDRNGPRQLASFGAVERGSIAAFQAANRPREENKILDPIKRTATWSERIHNVLRRIEAQGGSDTNLLLLNSL